MSEKNINTQEVVDNNQDSHSTPVYSEEQNVDIQTEMLVALNDIAQDTVQEDLNLLDDSQDTQPMTDAPAALDEQSEANSSDMDEDTDSQELSSGANVFEYETPTLQGGVSRLGRLDQAYTEGEIHRENIYGLPDEYINKPPYFPNGISLSPSAEDLQVKESGVVNSDQGDKGANTPELGTDTVTGTVTAIDPEGGLLQYFLRDASGAQVQELELEYGKIVLDKNTGEFIYILNNTDKDTDSLAQGEVATDNVTVYVQDDKGLVGANSLPVIITIEGTNDVPTLTVANGESTPLTVTEDGTQEGIGQATGNDVDTDAELTYSLVDNETETASVGGSYGTFAIDPKTGKYTYTLTNGTNGEAGPVQSLAKGEKAYDTFTVRVQDEHGAWADKTVHVTITGTNDAPTVDMSAGASDLDDLTVKESGVQNGGNVEETGDFSASGTIKGTDIDSDNAGGAGLVYTIEGGAESTGTNSYSTLATEYGELRLNMTTGEYTYTLYDTTDPNDVINKLDQGDTVNQTFTFVITDKNGATVTQEITFVIEGTNDVPTLTVANGESTPLTVTEDGTQEGIGQATGNDVDTDAELTYLLVDNGAESTSVGGSYGTLTIDPSTGQYTYTLTNGTNGEAGPVQSLAQGEKAYDSFTVRVQDEHGAWADKTVHVTITGTNDAPTVDMSAGASDLSDLTVKESGVKNGGNVEETGDFSASGTIKGTDIDSDNAGGTGLVYTIEGGTKSTGTNSYSTLSTEYGELSLNTTTGEYTYTLYDATDPNDVINKLDQGDKVEQKFTFVITDKNGATATQEITFVIEGTNDRPTLAIDTDSLAVAEGGITQEVGETESTITAPVLEASGSATRSDDDESAKLSYAVGTTPASVTQQTMNAAFDDVDATDANESHTVMGEYGTFTIADDGTYTYTLGTDASNTDATTKANAEALAEGETQTEHFTIYVKDEHGAWDSKDITVTITGGNDVPQVEEGASTSLTLKDMGLVTTETVTTETSTGNVVNPTANTATAAGKVDDWTSDSETANGTTHTTVANGSMVATDVDNGHTLTYSFTNVPAGQQIVTSSETKNGITIQYESITTEYGIIKLNTTDGTYTYKLDTTKGGTVDKMQENQWYTGEYTVQVADEHGMVAENTHAITVHIEGTNDLPELTITEDTTLGTVKEAGIVDMDDENNTDQGNTFVAGQATAAGTLTGKDVDDTVFRYGIVDGDGKHLLADGNTSSTYTNAAGTMVVDKDGNYTFTLNNDTYNYLTQGQMASTTFTFVVYDAHGAWTTKTITIPIEGTNDAPSLTSTPDIVVTDANRQDKRTGTPTKTDPDTGKTAETGDTGYNGDTHDFKVGSAFDENGELITQSDIENAFKTIKTLYGTVTVNQSNGKYTYTLDRTNQAVKALDAADKGETAVEGTHFLTDHFVLYIEDNHGGTDYKIVNVTINGVDDAPVFAAGTMVDASVVESGVGVPDIPENTTTSGILTVTDADADDAPNAEAGYEGQLTYTFINIGSFTDESSSDGLQVLKTQYGTITLNTKTGEYTYTLDQDLDEVEDFLPNSTPSEQFTVQVTDSDGLTATTTLLVTIKGTNDTPVITHVTGGVEGETLGNLEIKYDGENEPYAEVSVIENGTDTRFVGAIVASDVDHNSDKLTYSLVIDDNLVQTDYISHTINDAGEEIIKWQYGHIVLNQNTGSYVYYLDEEAAQGLSAGEIKEESFTVRVTDPLKVHDDITVTFKITGTDDAPEVSASTSSVKEDAGHDATSSDTPPSTNGTIHVTDIDKSDVQTFTLVSEAKGTYGTLVLHEDGSYTYTLDDNNTFNDATNIGIQNLKEGETLTETFVVKVTSGAEGATNPHSETTTITINIVGTNDAPTLQGGSLGSISKGEESLSGKYTNYNDIDNDAELTLGFMTDYDGDSETPAGDILENIRGKYGLLTIDNDGNYTYKLDSKHDDVLALGATDSLEDKFYLTVKDEHGASDTKEVTITITGQDGGEGGGHHDVTVEDTTAVTVKENTINSATGTITLADGAKDYDELYFEVGGEKVSSIVDKYGTLTIALGNDGKIHYTYTLHEGASSVEALAEGSKDEKTYTVCAQNGKNVSKKDITITIEGTNDEPIIDVVQADEHNNIISEISKGTIGGQVKAHDVDTGDELTYKFADRPNADPDENGFVTLRTEYGILKLNTTTGEYTYKLKNDIPNFPAGVNPTETVKVTVSDGTAHVETDITVTIKAENTAPNIEEELTLTVTEDVVADDNMVEASHKPEVMEPDTTATTTDKLSYAIAGTNGEYAGYMVKGTYGNLILDTDTGEYTYVLHNGNEDVQALGVGEHYTETFKYKVTDSHGEFVEKDITVTINGSNDAPEVNVSNSHLLVHETGSTTGSGETTVTDIDKNDNGQGANHVYSLQFVGADGKTVIITGSNDASSNSIVTKYGTVTLNADGTYTYVVDSDCEATKALAQGETVNETLTLLVEEAVDRGGKPVAQEIVVTIVGTNTAPELHLPPTIAMSDEKDADGFTTPDLALNNQGKYVLSGFMSGDEHVTDADSAPGDLTYSINTTDNPDHDPTPAQRILSKKGDYGTLVLNKETGAYTYTVNRGTVTALGVNDEGLFDTFTIVVRDEFGAMHQQQITVKITGVNDVPTVTVDNLSIDEGESSVTGKADVDDPDKTDTHEFSVTFGDTTVTATANDASINTAYGTFTLDADGNYSFAVNNDNEAVKHLGAEESLTETVTISVKDSGGVVVEKTVEVTINGVNDAPTLTVQALTVSEDAEDLTVLGMATITDDDTSDSHTLSIKDGNNTIIATEENAASKETSYGTFTLGADGNYSFTVNNDSKAVQKLGENESHTEHFTISVDDGHGGVITETVEVTINGVNDAPEFEDMVPIYDATLAQATGQLAATDIDGDDLSFSLIEDDGDLDGWFALDYGSVKLENGSYTYELNDGVKPDAGTTDSFTVQVSDGDEEVTTEITINLDSLAIKDETSKPSPSENTGIDYDAESVPLLAVMPMDDDAVMQAMVEVTANAQG